MELPEELKVEKARELLQLLSQARGALENARRVLAGGGDTEPALAKMRCRLIDAVWEDCLLFDEQTIYALSQFVGAWRSAAGRLGSDGEAEAEAAVEETYLIAADLLRTCAARCGRRPGTGRVGLT